MKLIKYLTTLLFVLVLSACSSSDDTTVQHSVVPVVTSETATQPEVAPTVETPVVATTPPIVDDIPVNEICNFETYNPCRAYPPKCKAGYVLQQGLCTLSVCNYETYIPCAVPPPVCEEGKVLIQGICVTVVQACPQGSTPCPPSPTPLPPNREPTVVSDPNPVPTCVRDSNPLVLVNGMLTDNCGNKYGQVLG